MKIFHYREDSKEYTILEFKPPYIIMTTGTKGVKSITERITMKLTVEEALKLSHALNLWASKEIEKELENGNGKD